MKEDDVDVMLLQEGDVIQDGYAQSNHVTTAVLETHSMAEWWHMDVHPAYPDGRGGQSLQLQGKALSLDCINGRVCYF
jgi:hypothetical protein